MEIQLLPEHIIDQIKAGEVIDSPAGIVKELIENSIDAGANNIEVHLVGNGLELISIKDNGKGIGFDDLPLAFARHATSKIETFEDLYRCESFGFRGEALASLASVAKVTCQSATKNESGQKIVLEGGNLLMHERLSSKKPQGTEVFIKELFFNTPARFKFMTSQAGEKAKIKKILNYYLISHPQVSFSIKWDDQDKTIYPPEKKESRFRKVSKLNPEELFEVSNQYEDLFLVGLIGKKEKARPIQYCYVNKRPVEDDRIKNTINHTLLSYGLSRKHDWILSLEIPQNKIDVNVHPKKTKIKFFQASLVYSLVSNALKHFFKSNKERQSQSQTNFEVPRSIEPMSLSQFGNNFQQTQPQHYNTGKNENFIGSKVNFSLSNSRIHFIKNNEFLIVEAEGKFSGSSFAELSQKILTAIEKAKTDITPLLVSDPLSVKNLKPETLKILGHLNIEILAIEKDYWVIKSLPDLLASFPSSLLDQFILKLEQNSNLEKVFSEVLVHCEQNLVELFYEKGFLKPINLDQTL